ncbi:MAG TPA: Uma2 family endonuclease [Thermoanaerobaculia bacterium]|jgi:Uma2 family endonuclease|nr:Uma2 family endonuclease [Thermoanaerobaculia bacterium]
MAEPIRKVPANQEKVSSSAKTDLFFYGYRLKHVHLPSGEEIEQQIPLTPEDLLDPQPGDVVGQSRRHFELRFLLSGFLERHYSSRKDVYVAVDMKMLWGIPGLPEPAPDIAVIQGVGEDDNREDFDVVEEGTRPCLVIEIVSSKDSETRRNDYERKVEIYQKVGIPEYLILDPPTAYTEHRLLMTGYRLRPDDRYRRIEPDAEGRLLSETTQLLFGVAEDGRTLKVIDAATGERLLTCEEMEAALAREAEARKAAEAEIARLRAELERLRDS